MRAMGAMVLAATVSVVRSAAMVLVAVPVMTGSVAWPGLPQLSYHDIQGGFYAGSRLLEKTHWFEQVLPAANLKQVVGSELAVWL